MLSLFKNCSFGGQTNTTGKKSIMKIVVKITKNCAVTMGHRDSSCAFKQKEKISRTDGFVITREKVSYYGDMCPPVYKRGKYHQKKVLLCKRNEL